MQQKKDATAIEKYGHVKNFSSSEHRLSSAATMKDRYGTLHAAQDPKVKDKIRKTHMHKYGKWYTQTDDYHSKRETTCLEKYSASHWMKTSYYQTLFSLHNGNRKITEIDLSNIKDRYLAGSPKQLLAEEFNVTYGHMNKIINYLGLESDLPQNKINYSSSFSSQAEYEIREVVEQIYPDDEIVYNDRQLIWPYELDIVNYTKKIAIEFNGTYWHSDVFKSRTYHKDKLEKVESLGFKLINIFENVYQMKKDVVISKLKSQAHISVIFARNVSVKEVKYSEISKFLEDTHIQGARKSKYNYGVFDQAGQLVGAATFNKFRDGVELVRLSSSVRIPGILLKILKFANFSCPIYSFANRNYTNRSANIYLTSGFVEIDCTAPNYFYVKGTRTLTRNQCMKHKLLKVIDHVDPKLSEYENMVAAGYHRYWDCGNLLYKYENKGTNK